MHDPFQLPEPFELEHEVRRPRWWYAHQMRIAGASWSQIAEALGYQTTEGVKQTVISKAEWGRQRSKEELLGFVDLELERLDMLQLIAWKTAKDGDKQSIDTILKIMATRMKLLGTESKSGDETTVHNTAIFIGGNEEEYKASLAQARDAAKGKLKAIEAQVIEAVPEAEQA